MSIKSSWHVTLFCLGAQRCTKAQSDQQVSIWTCRKFHDTNSELGVLWICSSEIFKKKASEWAKMSLAYFCSNSQCINLSRPPALEAECTVPEFCYLGSAWQSASAQPKQHRQLNSGPVESEKTQRWAHLVVLWIDCWFMIYPMWMRYFFSWASLSFKLSWEKKSLNNSTLFHSWYLARQKHTKTIFQKQSVIHTSSRFVSTWSGAPSSSAKGVSKASKRALPPKINCANTAWREWCIHAL